MSRFEYTVLLLFEFSKNFTCPLGKLRTKVTSPIAKSSSPRLSDSTFFARCHTNSYQASCQDTYSKSYQYSCRHTHSNSCQYSGGNSCRDSCQDPCSNSYQDSCQDSCTNSYQDSCQDSRGNSCQDSLW